MTHPLVTMLDSLARKEAAMSDDRKCFEANNALNALWQQAAVDRIAEERTERLHGYCDGSAGRRRSHDMTAAYTEGVCDGAFDRSMLANVAEWKRRAAIAPTSQNE